MEQTESKIKRPELLVSAGSIEDMKKLIQAGADAVVLGEQAFGMRLPGDVPPDELAEATAWAHQQGAKVYASVNRIFDDASLQSLPVYLAKLAQMQVDAIIFGDPAVLMAIRGIENPPRLHWNAEMTSTNYVTANYWATKGAKRVIIARELNMDETLDFKQNANLEVEVQVHGMTNIYHSKRQLLQTYFEHQGRELEQDDRTMNRGLYLIEQERQEEHYPIYEDANGTHIMSGDDICMLENLPELMDGGIDCFKIEGLLKPIEYNEAVVRSYRAVIDAYAKDPAQYKWNPEWLEAIEQVQDKKRELSFGFFYKEQVY